MKVLKWLSYFLIALALVLLLVFFGAKLSDGPIGPFPGGALKSGTLQNLPLSDWSFASNAGEIELQLVTDTSSRTTWIAVVDNLAYIPAALSFPPNKTWHEKALDYGAAIIRIEGDRYPVFLTRVNSSQEFDDVVDTLASQGALPPGGQDDLWIFRVRSR